MKYFVIFSLIVFLSSPLFAHAYLRDVVDGHWASDAVYDLVRRGVTAGFPDGTFRGKRNISRYEIAAFVANLARSYYVSRASDEKILQELKTELALIGYNKNKAQEENWVTGDFESGARASIIGTRVGRLDYRFKLSLLKTFDPNSSLRIRLDTMDTGFATGTSRGVIEELIDIEGNCQVGGGNLKINFGPGDVVPTASGSLFYDEKNTVFRRPKRSASLSGRLGGLTLSSAGIIHQVDALGKILVYELTPKVSLDFSNVSLGFQPRYVASIEGASDTRAEVSLVFQPDGVWETNFLWGMGAFDGNQDNLYVKIYKEIKDPWQKGTYLTLRLDRVGSTYRQTGLDEYEFIELNNFNRYVLDGTVDFGLNLKQYMSKNLAFKFLSDYVTTRNYLYGEDYAGTYLLWQAGLFYQILPRVELKTYYRSYNVPSGVDPFSDPVPVLSGVVGLGLNYSF